MSITSAEPAMQATQADLSQVLDFGNGADFRPAQGSFKYDQESGGYDISWQSLADFDGWRQEQKRVDSIDLSLADSECSGHHYSWKRVYRCSRRGSGGIKPYDKKYPARIRKFGPKWIGCPCKVDVKAYPGTTVLLGRYLKTHNHPIGMQNLIYTRVSKNAKGRVREFLEQKVEHSEIVCNRHVI